MAELYGKVEGCSHGYGGSMHLYDVERGNLGANAVVGGGLPAITGAALAFQLRGEPRVAVAFFGDGATNIGTFHESLNLAQLWRVPAVFVCENNHWAESTPAQQQLADRGPARSAPSRSACTRSRVDGQDVEEVYARRAEALEHARAGAARSSCSSRRTGSPATTSAIRRSTATRTSSARSRETQDPITQLRERLELSDEECEGSTARCTRSSRSRSSSRRTGTDPKPEDALKNVYA